MLDINKLKKEQIKLSEKVITRDEFKKLKLIGGCSQTYITHEKIISVVAVFDYKTLKVLETRRAIEESKIPYIPGYLSYKEVSVVILAYNNLDTKPDILMCNFNGILHPRRIGAASHLGLLLDIATIGVAKKLLCGTVKEGKVYVDGEIRGIELKTKEFSKPLYISPGHKISLGTALKLAKECIREFKMPVPLHYTHKEGVKIKHSLLNGDKPKEDK